MSSPVAVRIAQLLQLCGEDPRAAVAARHDVFPLQRRLEGWIVLTRSAQLMFLDDATGRMSASVPDEWLEEARTLVAARYPEIELS